MSKSTDTIKYTLPELATLILKDQGVHEGFYEVIVGFQMAVGAVGPDEGPVLPGAIFGVEGIGVVKVDTPTPLSVNAAEVNPPKRPRVSRAKST